MLYVMQLIQFNNLLALNHFQLYFSYFISYYITLYYSLMQSHLICELHIQILECQIGNSEYYISNCAMNLKSKIANLARIFKNIGNLENFNEFGKC